VWSNKSMNQNLCCIFWKEFPYLPDIIEAAKRLTTHLSNVNIHGHMRVKPHSEALHRLHRLDRRFTNCNFIDVNLWHLLLWTDDNCVGISVLLFRFIPPLAKNIIKSIEFWNTKFIKRQEIIYRRTIATLSVVLRVKLTSLASSNLFLSWNVVGKSKILTKTWKKCRNHWRHFVLKGPWV
jgi:hypothetical protein